MAGWEAALLHGTDGQRRLPAELRRRVRFISHNLADRAASAPVGAPFHVIFCRNVLIYFGARAAARVLEQLARCLAPGGYVFVSPLDLGHRVAELAPVEVGGVWLFRKEIPRPTHPPTDRPAPSWPPRAPTPPSPRSPGGDPVQEARQAADRGDLQTATAIARQAVTDQRSPTALHLLALILGEQDQRDEMRRLLEEAVARDAGYVQGHLCLGLLPAAASEHPAAARHLAAVLTLLAGAADQDVLPGPEPLRVALARHLAEQGQRNLQRAGSGGTP
jgi:chemotaxis protein methyltransferase CheR